MHINTVTAHTRLGCVFTHSCQKAAILQCMSIWSIGSFCTGATPFTCDIPLSVLEINQQFSIEFGKPSSICNNHTPAKTVLTDLGFNVLAKKVTKREIILEDAGTCL